MNRIQRRQLELYRFFQHREMSIASLLWFNRRLCAILLSVALVSVVAMQLIWGSYAAGLIAVAYATMFLRDLGYHRRSVISWPVTRELLDWGKVLEREATLLPPQFER
jgi:fumarate reductase subunit C